MSKAMQDNWDEVEKRAGRPTFAAPQIRPEVPEKLREWVTKKRDELNRYFHDMNYLGTVVLAFRPRDVAMLDAILAMLPPPGRVAVFATPEAVAHVTEGGGALLDERERAGVDKEQVVFLKRLRGEWLKKIIEGVPTYTYYAYEDIKLIDTIIVALEKPAELRRDMKYKKLAARSGCEWQIVKEEDDYLLAIVPHRGEEEADCLANAILSMLDERGGVSEEERRNFIAHYFWLAGRTAKGVRHIQICRLCQKIHRAILSGGGKVDKEGSGIESEIPEDRRGVLQALGDSTTSRGWLGRRKEFDAIRTLILSEWTPPALPSKEWEGRLDDFFQAIAPSYRSELEEILAGIGIQRGKEA